MQTPASTESPTVLDACHRFTAVVRAAKGAAAADQLAARYRRWIEPDRIAACPLVQLTNDDLTDFRGRLLTAPLISKVPDVRTRRPATAYRDLAALRAALNRAYLEGLVDDDRAWRTALRVPRSASQHQLQYLSVSQRQDFVAYAENDFKDLAQAMCLLPCPPSTMAALKVGDFDVIHATLLISRNKRTAGTTLRVPGGVADFLRAIVAGRAATEHLFKPPKGTAWSESTLKRRVAKTVRAAGLATGAQIPALRHSVITDMIQGGTPMTAVSDLSGISVTRLHEVYGHLASPAPHDIRSTNA